MSDPIPREVWERGQETDRQRSAADVERARAEVATAAAIGELADEVSRATAAVAALEAQVRRHVEAAERPGWLVRFADSTSGRAIIVACILALLACLGVDAARFLTLPIQIPQEVHHAPSE